MCWSRRFRKSPIERLSPNAEKAPSSWFHHHLAVKDAVVQPRQHALAQDRRHRLAVARGEVVAVPREPLDGVGPVGLAAAAVVQHQALAVHLVLDDVLATAAQQLVYEVPALALRQLRLERPERRDPDVLEPVCRVDAPLAHLLEVAHGIVELLGVGVEEFEDRVLLHSDVHVLQHDPKHPPLLARRRPIDDLAHHLRLGVRRLALCEPVEVLVELGDGEEGVLEVGARLSALFDHRVYHFREVALLVALEAGARLLPVEQCLGIWRLLVDCEDCDEHLGEALLLEAVVGAVRVHRHDSRISG